VLKAIPVGQPMAVTAISGNRVEQLAGAPAMQCYADTADALAAVALGVTPELTLGLVDGLERGQIGPESFTPLMIRSRSITEGWIEIDRPLQLGDVVQFHAGASALGGATVLRRLAPNAPFARAGLVFSGRPAGGVEQLLPVHDPVVDLGEILAPEAGVTTLVTSAELVRSAGRNVLGRTTTSVAIIGEGFRFDD
jgi:small ligand-binding sensory domain FIST